MAKKIKFGTDGWRAIIAEDYTIENLMRVCVGTALWLKDEFPTPAVVVGNDCRFGGKLFAETTARVFASMGIKTFLTENDFVSTPMVSLATKQKGLSAGIIITASHNPAAYNGFKIKSHMGSPASPRIIQEVEKRIPDTTNLELKKTDEYIADGLIQMIDLEKLYLNHLNKNFDVKNIQKSGFNFAYDSMFGAGQRVMRELFPHIAHLHESYNPGFMGIAPEPIAKNLPLLSKTVYDSGNIDLAFATDGDADRIGVVDSNGDFIDSHMIILMLIYYLHKIKKLDGQVIYTFSCCSKVKKMCDLFNLKSTICPIGFKYISDIITQSDEKYLLGGEESGGIAIQGHIPERDGIWIGLTLFEMITKLNKSIDEIQDDIFALVGKYACARIDLKLDNELKEKIVDKCKKKEYSNFGNYQVSYIEDIDGFKFHFSDDEYVLIRASGTEPVLRIYSEAENSQKAEDILDKVRKTILN